MNFPNVTVETLGSRWLIDEGNQQYMRMPKTEGPRKTGDWVEPQPGDALFDFEWHPYIDWEVVLDVLVIIYAYEDGMRLVKAPGAEIVRYETPRS